jgi:hypothetical protein
MFISSILITSYIQSNCFLIDSSESVVLIFKFGLGFKGIDDDMDSYKSCLLSSDFELFLGFTFKYSYLIDVDNVIFFTDM